MRINQILGYARQIAREGKGKEAVGWSRVRVVIHSLTDKCMPSFDCVFPFSVIHSFAQVFLFLLSIVLSRGIEHVENDMDDPNGYLLYLTVSLAYNRNDPKQKQKKSC
jgi:hypothetical protein